MATFTVAGVFKYACVTNVCSACPSSSVLIGSEQLNIFYIYFEYCFLLSTLKIKCPLVRGVGDTFFVYCSQ